ncbi:MAG TPA: alpha/beta hydrolase [Thermoanaerobaculales bacterium]|nr:alpha/beta hydrolase [Thermoanaerobaculales bacterium]
MGKAWRRTAVRSLVVLALVCATIVAGAMFLERQMIYFPTRYPDGLWELEAVTRNSGCTLEDCFFQSEDGLRLHGWWCRPIHGEGVTADMVLLWFHGNAGNLSHRADLMLRLARTPAQVVIVDYRGYGRSEGKPSERGLYRDADAAWRYLIGERRVAPERVVLLGDSLGAAVAVDLAARVEAAGLIVQSGFTSIPDLAARHFPFVPRALIRTKMDSLSKIPDVRGPKLFLHSPEDEVVPYGLGRRLYEAAAEPKRFLEVPGASHNDLSLVGGHRYFDAIATFLSDCRRRAEGRTRG